MIRLDRLASTSLNIIKLTLGVPITILFYLGSLGFPGSLQKGIFVC